MRQMYVDMNAQQTIPLNQLAVANPDLFAQMRVAAEAAVHAYDRGGSGGGGGGAGGVGGNRGIEPMRIDDDAPANVEANADRKVSLRSATGLGVGIYPKGPTGERKEGPFVNAFLAEAPVVLDIGRAQCLLRQLLDTESKAAATIDAESLFNGKILYGLLGDVM